MASGAWTHTSCRRLVDGGIASSISGTLAESGVSVATSVATISHSLSSSEGSRAVAIRSVVERCVASRPNIASYE